MGGRCAFIACLLCGVLIANKAYELDEKNYNSMPAEVLITENKELKQIEVRHPSKASGTLPGSPTLIQQGNNVYIKPKIIFGSPFTAYKQGSSAVGCCDNMAGTPNVPNEETSLAFGKIPTQHLPPVVIPPVLLPPLVDDSISITPPKFLLQPHIPIDFNSSCFPMQFPITADEINIPMRCPSYVLNMPAQTKFPTLVNKPVVIPKPPVLPPIKLPKLPVHVIIRKPIFTKLPGLIEIPDQLFVPSVCPSIAECIPMEKNSPSSSDILTVVFEKFKNLLSIPNSIDFSQFFVPDDEVLRDDLPPAFPTLCAQGIIAERIVPNIIENDEVKVFMSPIFPSQLTQSGFYRK